MNALEAKMSSALEAAVVRALADLEREASTSP
jgi:hypothetical protein